MQRSGNGVPIFYGNQDHSRHFRPLIANVRRTSNMETHIDNRVVCGLLALLALLVCIGCSADASVTQVVPTSDSSYIVKAESVGDYQIGKSTLDEIMGSVTAKNRRRFADAGLNFEFNQGKELTGVTVTSSDYALENGLTIGSPSSDVINKLGEPRRSKIELEPKDIELDALVYDEFVFLLDGSKNVAAIRIGN
jgi:hypothetical protein